MILGILSDSHGRAQRTAAAVRTLRACGAAALIHCGDIGSPDVLSELSALPAHFVWGNNDDEDGSLARYADALGLPRPPRELPLNLTLAQRRIAVCHGHERAFADLWRCTAPGAAHVATPIPHYLLFGHTHLPADERRAGARFINPGALHRASVYTVATLDLERDALAFWEICDDAPPDAPPQEWRFTRL